MFLAAFAMAMLFSNQLLAGDPKTETLEDISNNMVEFLHNDVKLTTIQKETVRKKAKEYAEKLLQARAMSDKEASYAFMKNVSDIYSASMDSILTPEQKAMKDIKMKDRMDFITNGGKI